MTEKRHYKELNRGGEVVTKSGSRKESLRTSTEDGPEGQRSERRNCFTKCFVHLPGRIVRLDWYSEGTKWRKVTRRTESLIWSLHNRSNDFGN